MQITRHYLTLAADPASGKPARRVHYRRCGSGAPLLMVHQSPRSSAEYEPLMRQWGEHFTCIAPDTPGFGQSDPLAHPAPEIDEYADALGEFITALGIAPCPAYGFHSGGIICVTASKRQPGLFSALAIGGYPVWTQVEMDLFGGAYLPEFKPSMYGEHLTWLWHRFLGQSWFFPWFDVRDETRLSVAHADPLRVQPVVMEMLDAGEHYRTGYGAVLRAPRDIPAADAAAPPCLISAYDGDPLQAHLDRLGEMPAGWSARKVATPAEHQAHSLAFLMDYAGAQHAVYPQDEDAGWLPIGDGLIHWHGTRGADLLTLHAPGAELEVPVDAGLAIDVPGHGLSSSFDDVEAVIRQAAQALGVSQIAWPTPPPGDADVLYPDLTPDRFGGHLGKAWSIARAQALFEPWYSADKEHIVPVKPESITPPAIANRARALLRAGPAARQWHEALLTIGEENTL